MTSAADVELHRGRLFAVAYRMLGMRADAEDAVQEAYLRWHRRDAGDVRDPLAWLVTVVTRICLDRLRVLSAERERYVGPWLPEPLVAGPEADDPARHAELAADLSVAYLLVLERLAPEERAAFLLHEAFGYQHAQIAQVLGKNEAAVRQLVHRARERVHRERPRFLVDRDAARAVVERFLHALEERDVDALLRVLAEDVTHTADGGGRGAARNVVRGRDRVSRLLLGLQRKFWGAARIRPVDVNGAPGFLLERDGVLRATVALETDGERVRALYVVVNPEKLPSLSC
ncbi:MAG TPA: RNA polymerase sigma-70 factor [Candidatus Limnocylindria bacterium]|nr:RNA polymerase sigma-70 factor [Candidatus Limnocylindria bacterium]